jgi:hypothetical protein
MATANAAIDAFTAAKQQGASVEMLGLLAKKVEETHKAYDDALTALKTVQATSPASVSTNPRASAANSYVGSVPTTIAGSPSNSSYGPTVVIQPGAITHNFPIMRDREAMTQLGAITGDAVMQRLVDSGWQSPANLRRG